MKQSFLEANMKLLEKISSGVMEKMALATALMGGFLAFAGAGTASAHPRVVVGVGIGGPGVVRGYVGPGPVYVAPRPYYGPVYVGPRYGYAYYHGPRVRYWDARFHCWRYR
jgi:hypothetical protein